jgi:hypothetical protein
MPLTGAHEEIHRDLDEQVARLLGRYREKFLIPPRWKIDTVILCPDQMAKEHDDNPGVMASMTWEFLPNAHYRLRVRCDLDATDLEWCIMHELLEALTAPYADLMVDTINALPGSYRTKLHIRDRHHEIRDEIIEWMLDIIAPEKRPNVRPSI